jgi:hypothetical protein
MSAVGTALALLVVVEGADAGRRFALLPGSFRVIGRGPGVNGTHVVERAEQLRLEDEDHRRIAAHAGGRHAPGLLGARGEVAGYTRDGDVELFDDAVSQTHGIVFCDDAGLSIVDVDSRNGTWVNGDRVYEAVLVVGDLVRVGETRLQVQLPGEQ